MINEQRYVGEVGYLKLLSDILEHGEKRIDRTGTGTLSLFAPADIVFDLREGFPLLTSKRVAFKTMSKELEWFLSGSTNVVDLIEKKCNIWNHDAYRWYKSKTLSFGETNVLEFEDFVEKLKVDDSFAERYGDLGPIYGAQWRDFGGVDQLVELIEGIKRDPFSRRHIISGWNPGEQHLMALPPCHVLYHFSVSKDGYISLKMYQRSGDMFLGVPFNIASSSLLLSLIAKECNLKPGYFIHSFGDAHIYLNHIEQVKKQLNNKPMKLPKLKIDEKCSVLNFKYTDVDIVDYDNYGTISGKVSVG